MTILQLPQGHYGRLDGFTKAEALAIFEANDARFLAENPQCAKWHRPCWVVLEVGESDRAPWGHEWYAIDADGRLRMHSAQYDSSG